MLAILHAVRATAVDAFRGAENLLDGQLLADLEAIVERTRLEIERLSAAAT